MTKGNLKISSENIFPIIKKWLYSEHDIFLRELVSNASDAITKLKRLSTVADNEIEISDELKIVVKYDDENKTISIEDNGIGMTYDEVNTFINEIAFSGAESFVNTFKDSSDKDQIIGHFGLGFYSAFMVASKVTIDTLSYKSGEKPVKWESNGDASFEMGEGSRATRGTLITLYLSDEGEEFKNEYKIKNILNKYCSFMPHNIYFEGKEDESNKDEEVKPINTTTPLYAKNPSEITEEEYKEFYRNTFVDFKEPLFNIHLNMEYPFNLKGILYFPKITADMETLDGRIKLYNSQVFVADNIKEVIPEYLLLLKGVIDCPDLPLNVSRSFLQTDGFVKKISDYISKKVSDKLTGLFKTDRENYEKYWRDINIFVKYGCLKDDKFFEKVKNAIIFENIDGKFESLDEIKEGSDSEITIYYADDKNKQSSYIKLLTDENKKVVILEERIDSAFINLLESRDDKIKFKRVDASVDSLKSEEFILNDEDKEKITEKFKKALKLDTLNIEINRLKSKSISSLIVESEESRRMSKMMKMYSMGSGADLPKNDVVVLNENNELIKNIMENKYDNDKEEIIINQIYDLARLSAGTLTANDMDEFVKRTNEILKQNF